MAFYLATEMPKQKEVTKPINIGYIESFQNIMGRQTEKKWHICCDKTKYLCHNGQQKRQQVV
jgi:hypothetical protein